MSFHLYKSIEFTTPRVNPNVNYELWVIMMWQYRFMKGNKCTALVRDFDHREAMSVLGKGSLYIFLSVGL